MKIIHRFSVFIRRLNTVRRFFAHVVKELAQTRAFDVAAALSFYFLLSLVPLLIVLAAVLSFLPVPTLFDQLLDLMSILVPPEAMDMVQKIVANVLSKRHGGILSFGIVSYVWAASGGFSAVIDSLNIAYRVPLPTSWWRTRTRALLLTATTGAMLTVSLLLLVAGPGFGRAIEMVFPVPVAFGNLWLALRPVVAFAIFLLGILILYVLGPSAKVSFRSALPGALVAVASWFLGSALLTFYIQHLVNYNVTYGSLGAVIALMLWFYLVALAILVGAEINALLARGAVETSSKL